ncbi:MAG: hypothetical protein ACXADH_00875 [Candidatus Kariarchaeaceae archaeon]|jgi:hypothetical protein
MDFLSGLEPIQWVFLGLGVVIAAPPLFQGLGKVFSNVKDNIPSGTSKNNTLTDLVCKWECLSDAVHEAGLHDACKKLDEVFPLLIAVKEDEIVTEPEKEDE